MIDLSEIVQQWPEVDGWHISPGVEWCAAGNRVRIGARVRICDEAVIGDGAKIGNGAKIGYGAKIGDGAIFIADIGAADGHRKCISAVDGVAYIGAGCRWFTLADALKHWGNHPKDRRATMCLMEAAKAFADLRGIKWGEPT